MIADYLGQSRLPHPRQSTPREGGGHVEVYEDRRFGAACGCHHGSGSGSGSPTVGISRRCPIDAGDSTQACGSAGRREDGSAFLLRGGAVWLRAVPTVDDDGLRLLCGGAIAVAAASRQRRPRITCTRSNSTLWSRRVVAHVSRSRCVMTCHLPTLWKTLLLTLCFRPATLATVRCVRLYSVRCTSDVRSETT